MSGAISDGGAVLAWRQLLRIGNVFTAISNVGVLCKCAVVAICTRQKAKQDILRNIVLHKIHR